MKYIGCLTVFSLCFFLHIPPVSAGCSEEERKSLQNEGYSPGEIKGFCEERDKDEKGFYPKGEENGGKTLKRSRATVCQCPDGRSCQLDPFASISRGSDCLCPPGPSGSCQGIATR